MAVPTGPAFRGSGAVTSATAVTSRSPVKPTDTVAHGILIAVVTIKSIAAIATATPGWTLLYQDNSGIGFSQALFIARGDAAAPVFTWAGAANASAYINYYDDPGNPISVTVGAATVGAGTGVTAAAAGALTTRANSVVAAFTAVDVNTTPGAATGYTTNASAGSGTSIIGVYTGSVFVPAILTTTAFSQTVASGNWVTRLVELQSTANPVGLWTIETEFAANTRVGNGNRATELEFASSTKVGAGSRASEVEFASVARVGDGIRASEVEFVAVLIPGVEPPPPEPAPQISKVRTWGFSLDGHDFYCLRLGNQETLVFDLTTGENVPWDSFGREVWRAHQGLNWIGIGREIYQSGVASNVIAGDDSLGILWVLDPEYGVDDGEDFGAATTAFTRVITTGIPLRERQATTCDSVFVIAANGAPFTGQESINLRTSDDNGKTWQDQGSVALTAGDFSQEITWRSLGKVTAPGRIFEFTDTGATVRIDSVDVLFRGV